MEKLVGFQIRTLANLIRRRMDQSLSDEFGNTRGVCGWALGYLYRHQGEAVFQRDFENAFQIRRSTATTILQSLEKKELIRREPVAEDGRLKQLVLTEKGVRLNEEMDRLIQATEERLCKEISQEDLTFFLRLADQMKNNLEEGSS